MSFYKNKNIMVRWCTVIPVRIMVAVLIFFGSFVAYMIRAHLSVMIIKISTPLNYSLISDPDCHNRLRAVDTTIAQSLSDKFWKPLNPLMVATLFSTYSWGYSFSVLLAKVLGEKFGLVRMVGYSTMLTAGLTLLTPLAYDLGVYVLIAVRFLVGVLSGLVFPLLHGLIINWSPMTERNAFGATLYGTAVGIIVTYVVSACILVHWSWPWIAYVSGMLAIVWALIWVAFVTDTPAEHTCVTPVELENIQFRRVSSHIRRVPKVIPWGKVIRSRPVRALFILLWANTWNLSFYVDFMPLFFHRVLNYDVVTAALLASIPIISRTVCSWICIPLAKHLIRRNRLSVGATRKLFTFVSHILPAAIQLGSVYWICYKTITIIEVILMLGLNGAISSGGTANIVDLTPHFAGSVYNSMQALLSIAGICVPYMVGIVLLYFNNRLRGWILIMTINAALYLFGGIVFLIFGSGTIQPWDVSTVRGTVYFGIIAEDEADELDG